MRSVIILFIGFIALGLSLALSRLFTPKSAKATIGTTVVFPLAWLIFCLVNVAIGIRAGYSIAIELIVFAITFGIPAVAAALIARSKVAVANRKNRD